MENLSSDCEKYKNMVMRKDKTVKVRNSGISIPFKKEDGRKKEREGNHWRIQDIFLAGGCTMAMKAKVLILFSHLLLLSTS